MAGKILLLGATGLLGSAFARTLGDRAHLAKREDVHPKSVGEGSSLLNVGDYAAVINCIANTKVEAAEADPRDSWFTNAFLPGVFARAALRAGNRFVHFSSTGCYGDAQEDPWDDFARTSPKSTHHKSKLAGEREVRQAAPNALILRTGWLYGTPPPGRNDFVRIIRDQALGNNRLLSDPGQSGNPTSVDDVVAQTMMLIEHGVEGTLNCVARGTARRIDYVSEIVSSFGLPTKVDPAPVGHFKRLAPVSSNEAAINLKLNFLGLEIMPHWQEALRASILALRAEESGQHA